MLVLTRKVEERVIIDGNIEITILGIRGNRVRLGVKAPRDVPILRGELARREQDSIEPPSHASWTISSTVPATV